LLSWRCGRKRPFTKMKKGRGEAMAEEKKTPELFVGEVVTRRADHAAALQREAVECARLSWFDYVSKYGLEFDPESLLWGRAKALAESFGVVAPVAVRIQPWSTDTPGMEWALEVDVIAEVMKGEERVIGFETTVSHDQLMGYFK